MFRVHGIAASDAGRRSREVSAWIRCYPTGRIEIKVGVRDSMPDGLVRIPHGWWKPEMEQGLRQKLSGALRFADAMLCPDDEDYLDREQGIPHLKGLPCRIVKLGQRKAGQGDH